MGNNCVAQDADQHFAAADEFRVKPTTRKVEKNVNLSKEEVAKWAKKIAEADNLQETLPILTDGPGAILLSVESAYAIQRQFVLKVGGLPSGYKQGFTSPTAREKLGKAGLQALYGTLMPNSVHDVNQSEDPLELDFGTMYMLECELCFTLSKDIEERPLDLVDLRRYFGHMQPCVEVTCPPYNPFDTIKFGLEDLIATNVLSHGLILGGNKQNVNTDIRYAQVCMRHGTEVVNEGGVQDVVQGHWESVFDIVTFVLNQGWPLKKNMHILTGCLGQPVLAKPGKYVADFGTFFNSFGDVEFELRRTPNSKHSSDIDGDMITFWKRHPC